MPTDLYLASQTRELDRIAIEECGIPGRTLMQRAGEAAFRLITGRYGETRNMVVVCGSGNNGGDGYVVAGLALRSGIPVTVVALGEPGSEDASHFYRDYVARNGPMAEDPALTISQADLLVDALFGTGLSRAPDGVAADLVRHMNDNPCPLVALDICSGLGSDTGRAYDPCASADVTVTFIGAKLGLFTGQGPAVSGDLVFDDLAVPADARARVDARARLVSPPRLSRRARDLHKGQAGRVWIAGGDRGMLGAVLMAGETALRGGAGLVTVLTTEDHLDRPALYCPALMSAVFDEQGGAAENDLPDALVLGPGLGQGDWGERVFDRLAGLDVPRVIDADGLNWLAAKPSRSDRWVLTPHPGEAARLLNTTVGEVQGDRVAAASEIVGRFGGTCVLKGPGTMIASTEGPLLVCDRGNPGMASAGMGDVLAGLIGALLAQGVAPGEAASVATWLHGEAADRRVTSTGERGLIASDMPAAVAMLWPEYEAR